MRIPIESSTSYRGRNSRPNLPALVGFVALALTAAATNALFGPGLSTTATRWWAMLIKPDWPPPLIGFAVVALALYVSMGTAAWIVWRERYHRNRNVAIAAFTVQLLLNASWAPAFFGLKNIGAGLFEIVVLWLAVGWTLREFSRVRPAAALLLTPYFLGVSLAVIMNFSIWKLNP